MARRNFINAGSHRDQPRRRVKLNHDAGVRALFERVPADLGIVLDEAIGGLSGSHVDAVFWNLGTGHVCEHDTRVGDFVDDELDAFDSLTRLRLSENSRKLIEAGHECLKEIIEQGPLTMTSAELGIRYRTPTHREREN